MFDDADRHTVLEFYKCLKKKLQQVHGYALNEKKKKKKGEGEKEKGNNHSPYIFCREKNV